MAVHQHRPVQLGQAGEIVAVDRRIVRIERIAAIADLHLLAHPLGRRIGLGHEGQVRGHRVLKRALVFQHPGVEARGAARHVAQPLGRPAQVDQHGQLQRRQLLQVRLARRSVVAGAEQPPAAHAPAVGPRHAAEVPEVHHAFEIVRTHVTVSCTP
jgi:hypothetical protein